MNENENQSHQKTAKPKFRKLRIWPAIILLIGMWGVWIIPGFFEEVSMTVMMAQFMGPLALSLLVLLWWPLLSRASWKEKVLGFAGFIALLIITNLLADKTVQGFLFVMFAAPWAITGFVVALMPLASNLSARRTWIALLVSLVCFGYWTLIRVDEYRGDFETARSWRWQPSAEDLFMKDLADRGAPAAVDSSASESIVNPEWPEFRGPQRNSVLTGVVLGEDWQTHPPKEIWRKRIGPGWSSFSVAGNLLFTQEQRGENEAIVCYDANSGAEIWAHLYPSRFFEAIGGVGPRGTPTLKDGKLFALGAAGMLHRLNPLTGEQVWQRDIGEDSNRDPPTWGFSSSPLVVNDVAIVYAGGAENKGLLAYDVNTGELRWGASAGNDTYSSPHLSNISGKTCVLMLTNEGLTLVNPTDGKILGEHEWKYSGYRVLQPLVVGDSSVLLGTFMGAGTRRIEVSFENDAFAAQETWTSPRINPYFNDFVAHDGYLYGFDNNIFACVDLATGERKWKKGRYGNGQVLLLPDGDQLLVTSEDGELVLLRATPDDLEELGRHQILGGRTWNHPVLVGNRLYVRNGTEAACFELQVSSLTGIPSDQQSAD